MNEWFRRTARFISDACGTWQAFVVNVAGVLIWLALGWPLHWSDSWQLLCNTFTTIVTYLLVFLVMNTQARDTAEMRIKTDAIILALSNAPNKLVDLDELSADQMDEIKAEQSRRAASEMAANAPRGALDPRSTPHTG